MGFKAGFNLSVVFLIAAMVSKVAMAQSGCTTALVGLMPCLNYVSGNSSTPTTSCCTQLTSVVQQQPQCLCALVKGGSSTALGLTINQTLALALPAACNVQTPPVAQCDAVNGPTSSAPSPADSPSADQFPEAPTESNSDMPSETGSKSVPGVEGSSGGTVALNGVGMFILAAASISWATFCF